MPVFADRVKVATTTTGTGTLTLGAPQPGFQSFAAAGIAPGDQVTYVIEEGQDVEIGTGVYSDTGPSLTRATVHRSIVGGTPATSKITLAGTAQVYVTARAADIPAADEVAAQFSDAAAQRLAAIARLEALEDEIFLQIGVV